MLVVKEFLPIDGNDGNCEDKFKKVATDQHEGDEGSLRDILWDQETVYRLTHIDRVDEIICEINDIHKQVYREKDRSSSESEDEHPQENV